jgi:hypothetical protein
MFIQESQGRKSVPNCYVVRSASCQVQSIFLHLEILQVGHLHQLTIHMGADFYVKSSEILG